MRMLRERESKNLRDNNRICTKKIIIINRCSKKSIYRNVKKDQIIK